ncbi:MAG: CNNM domain-containing protein, partial [Clostridia bacterium]|nr:CNNM domain-containing protein [Clostridia bacterium]
MDNWAYLLIIFVCLILSAFFSATETAFSSYSHAKMKAFADIGKKGADRVLKLSEKFDSVLSTILIGNNIVNILSATLATVLFTKWLNGSASAATVSTAVMTVIVLVFAEISPKSLAKEHAEGFAIFSAVPLKAFMFVFTPLNLLFGLWKKLLTK